jgi:uncharacterized protein YndB with AHSA1/START domain
MDIVVKVSDTVHRPITDVFNAVIDPASMTCYFISRSTGPMVAGSEITWYFDDYNVQVDVTVIEIVSNEKVVFTWVDDHHKSRVDILFTSENDQKTTVTITESSFPNDEEGIAKSMNQTQGWTHFLCCLKAFLYTGINLRNGKMNS